MAGGNPFRRADLVTNYAAARLVCACARQRLAKLGMVCCGLSSECAQDAVICMKEIIEETDNCPAPYVRIRGSLVGCARRIWYYGRSMEGAWTITLEVAPTVRALEHWTLPGDYLPDPPPDAGIVVRKGGRCLVRRTSKSEPDAGPPSVTDIQPPHLTEVLPRGNPRAGTATSQLLAVPAGRLEISRRSDGEPTIPGHAQVEPLIETPTRSRVPSQLLPRTLTHPDPVPFDIFRTMHENYQRALYEARHWQINNYGDIRVRSYNTGQDTQEAYEHACNDRTTHGICSMLTSATERCMRAIVLEEARQAAASAQFELKIPNKG
jgi:hypothetical protein